MTESLAEQMKAGMRRLAAGVSVLTTRDKSGRDYAMTVSSVTSVSDSPASLLVCVNKQTSICPVLSIGHDFAINLLASGHDQISNLCATGQQSEQRFSLGNWDREGQISPLLKDAEACFICQVSQVFEYGTHNIVVGDIQQVSVASSKAAPLVYLDGAYRQIN